MSNKPARLLTVMDADELRDILPESGLFDMLDCEVELICPPNARTSEIEKMVNIIESMINVTDIRVSGVPRSESELSYNIKISNVPMDVARTRLRG
jgi:hypothetical protein